jgi:antitoxin (DNA-binding transcriptional repressor) of toxin-antitoxin stability system
MKFFTVRDFRTSPARIWEQLPIEQELIITNNGKPIALLTPLTDETLEETVKNLRKVKAVNAVQKMQGIATQKGLSRLSEQDIEDEITQYRKNKK